MLLDQSINDFFKTGYERIVAVYLFGSQAGSGAGKAGDIDIGLLFEAGAVDSAGECVEDILVKLPRVLRRDVHPTVMNTAGEELLRQIFSKGRCVVVKDENQLANFKMTAFARIADYSYYRQIFQRGVIRRVSAGGSVG